MPFSFHKYQGAGNDFIIIDARQIDDRFFDEKNVNRLCNRNFGIGADGLILLQQSDGPDFRMKYFNSDGKEGTMCGNGGRCIAAFARSLGLIGSEGTFEGIDGKHEVKLLEQDIVSLKMTDVAEIKVIKEGMLLDTGSKHLVIQKDSIDGIDVFNECRSIRYQDRFGKDGTNVNYIEKTRDGLKIRTYERGVENETLACGTGAVAAAISAYFSGITDKTSLSVQTRGGKLKVDFTPKENNQSFIDVWLTGPAKFVFEGKVST